MKKIPDIILKHIAEEGGFDLEIASPNLLVQKLSKHRFAEDLNTVTLYFYVEGAQAVRTKLLNPSNFALKITTIMRALIQDRKLFFLPDTVLVVYEDTVARSRFVVIHTELNTYSDDYYQLLHKLKQEFLNLMSQ